MRKKLLSALLALAMVLSLLPTTAFAAAEPGTQTSDIISYVSFAYTHPPVMPDDWDGTVDEGEQAAFDALRNVFVVGFQTRVQKPAESAKKYSFAVKGSDGQFKDVVKYYYAGQSVGVAGSGAAYFEAPEGVLASTTNTYTVKVTETESGNYQEKEITLVKVSLKANNGTDLAPDNFIETEGLITEGSGYCVFAPQDKAVVYLPTLKNGTEGGGTDASQEFVGWGDISGVTSGNTYISTSKAEIADRPVYAVFGVKPVRGYVVTDTEPSAWQTEMPERKTAFETAVNFGAESTDNKAIKLRIVNTGNQQLGSADADSGFYVMSNTTDHFNIAVDITEDAKNANQVNQLAKYWLGAGENENQKPVASSELSYLTIVCTPKKDLPAGTYTDTLTINNPLRYITQVTLKLTVKPTEVTVEMPDMTKEYGQHIVLDADGKWGEKGGPTVKVNGDTAGAPTFSELGVTITSDGFHAGAEVREGGYGYSIEGQPSNGNYNVTLKGTGKVTVNKAKPEGDISVTASAIKKNQKLTDSVLQGAFVNPNHKDWKVEGQFEWTDATKENIIDSVPEEGYVVGNWKFTPANNNYEEVTGTVNVVVSDKTPTTIHLNTNKNRDTVTFDGAEHRLDFTLSYTDNEKGQQHLDGEITTEYKPHTGAADTEHGGGGYSAGWPVEAGVYDVKAKYEGTDKYAPAEAVFHLTIVPRTLTMISTVKTKTYDGTTKAEINIAALIEKVPGKDDVSVSSYNAHFNDANAGDNKNVEITDIELSNHNYKLASETFHATGTIAPKSIALKVEGGATLSKYYGETFNFDKNSFTSDEDGFVSGDGMDNLDVTFSSAGADSDAAANTNGYPITATLNTRGNYTISNVTNVGTLKVEKAVLTENCIKQQPSANPIVEGNKKSDVVINAGSVVNPHNDDMTVEGHWELTEAGDETFSQAGFEELNWTFKPTDTTNYSGALAGTITVQVMDEQPIAITVPESILTVTYNGKEQEIDVTRITTEPAATVTVGYNGNRTDAGTCEVIITATPEAGSETDKTYGETVGRYTLTIQKADVTVTPSSGISAKEGDTLPKVENPERYFTDVDGDPLSGTFTWENPTATVTQESENFKWSFVPEDTTNYNSPVTGEFTVTMAADDRTVKADVYNLPESDYAVVNTATSCLEPGEKVIFYKDAACKDPVSSETEVPADNNGKFIVNLDNDALDKETGTIYAKIVGQKTEKATISYPAELGFTLPNDMVLLHVGGANADKSETVSVVFSNDSYRSLVTADTWTVAGDGANFVEVTDNNNGSATFTAKAAGTTTITVSVTFKHPDTAKTETITVTKEFSLNITSHYVVFTDETVTGGTATANPTEADKGDAVTVTLAPASGYRASGLEAYYRSADGTPDEAHPVTVTGSGSAYTFTMPASDVVLVPAFTQIPSGGGGSIGGGGAGGGGAAGPSTTTEPDTTVITPEAAADASGEARAPVDAAEVESAVESAKQSGADEIVIEPQVTGNADKVSVELEKKSVDTMADGTDADLTVKTDAANVTLPNESLEDLAAKTGSKVTVSVEEKTGGEVGIEVAIDGKPMDSLSGGLKVDLPKTSGGNVLVIVGEDGSEKVVKKSVVENGHAYALLDGSCSVKVVNNSKTFADVAATDWYSDAVEFAGSHELFNGVGKNNFAPNEPMTRGMFATVLWRFESGEHVDASGTFADVAEGDWYTDGIVWASRHGIITGYSSDTFAPADNVTREQLATMLYRYAKDIGLDVSETGSLNRFSDSDDVSAYAKDAVAWAVGVGLIKGNTDNTINPAGGAKRAEVATIFMRFCELITK